MRLSHLASNIKPVYLVTLASLWLGPTACLKPNSKTKKSTAGATLNAGFETSETQVDGSSNQSDANAKESDVQAFSEAESVAYLKEACDSCHNSQSGAVASFWPMHANELSAANLSADDMAPHIYYALLAKSKGLASGTPSPMPPAKLSSENLLKTKRVVRWFEQEMPAVVAVAKAKFQGVAQDASETAIVLNYTCREPLSLRAHLNQLTNDFFDRPPTQAELKAYGDALDKPVTSSQRESLAGKLFADATWKKEFEARSLRKFSDKLSGSSGIKPTAGISIDQAQDLRSEFYQLLLSRYQSMSYKDILLSNTIMVSDKTSSLYSSCRQPDVGQWAACTMQAPRGSYFSSLSFLLSQPSSFLLENNNYGRTKLLHFFISGDVFKSAFDKISGDQSVKPLPDCLRTNDARGLYNADKTHVAAYGTASVPATGNLCQSCHIARHMAAGSLVFRPYAPSGLMYERQTPVRYDPLIDEATSELHVYKDQSGQYQRVSLDFLLNLLNSSQEQACAVAMGDAAAPTKISTVRDLAQVLVGDGRILATGLARHIPRAMSNKAVTTEELITRIMGAYAKSGGMLKDVFIAYAASESYACKTGGGEEP